MQGRALALRLGVNLFFLARPEGFEPPATGFEVRCSIQLSYGRLITGLVLGLQGNVSRFVRGSALQAR